MHEVPQFADFGAAVSSKDIVDHQTVATRPVGQGQGHHLLDGGMFAQGGFDFTQLDPVAPDLDLVIDPPQELNGPIRQVSCQIAGIVEPGAGRLGKRIGDEALGRQSWPFVIPAHDPRTTDNQFACHPDRHRLP